MWCLEQRRKANRQRRLEPLGQRQQFRISPHVRRPLGNPLTSERSADRRGADGVIVRGNFQRRETIVADRAGLVSPGSAAFPATQFVSRHHALSSSACGTSRKKYALETQNLFSGEMEKRRRDAENCSHPESHVPH